MTVFEIDPLRDSRWKELVENNPKASVFHRSEWLQALKVLTVMNPWRCPCVLQAPA